MKRFCFDESSRVDGWIIKRNKLHDANKHYIKYKLSLYYRYYNGRCSDELRSVIPPKACFARSTRFAESQHSFAVKLEKCRTTSFANTFVSMTSKNWNSPPASVFPSTYNLQTFKIRVHKHHSKIIVQSN